MIRAHWSAVEGLLSGLSVGMSVAPTGTSLPYVVLHPDQGAAESRAFSGDTDWRPWSFQTTCVGDGPDQAQWLAERVESRLLDVIPFVSGRECTPIRKVTTVPIDRDDDVSPPLFVARDIWAFSSIPA